jgi:hypothetical protein
VGTVVGQAAAVRLVAGQVLVRGVLTGEPVPGPDEASVGLSLRPGQLPGDGLEPGDRVRVLAVPSRDPAAGGPVAPERPVVLAEYATVYSVRPDPAAGGNTVLTVVVPAGQADLLTAYGSAGQVGVVEEAVR